MDIIISINKPKGISSQDAVTKVKKILRVKKAGHAGTLDPMATGLLIVCVNRATRLASYFSGLDKEYRAVMKLGEATDTQDACGRVISRSDRVEVEEGLIRETLRSFEGRTLQQPPMFSALKHKGKSLYTYARQGIEIERQQREVNIRRIELLDISLPHVSFKAACSKGTYIRTLCHDIGQKLGTGAHLSALERTAVGTFSIGNSLTFEELISVSRGDHAEKGIYTMDEALSWLPEFILDKPMLRSVIHGNPVMLDNIELRDEAKAAPGIRIKSPDGGLLAIGSYSDVNNMLKMDVVFV
ncbi:MAG: tRNA pseudouridine(55) synthase TruB [Nitrospirota bacterium]|nr:tRNA pseudouridine(55) synthase TruB [Nitrospirota bacterium]